MSRDRRRWDVVSMTGELFECRDIGRAARVTDFFSGGMDLSLSRGLEDLLDLDSRRLGWTVESESVKWLAADGDTSRRDFFLLMFMRSLEGLGAADAA